MLSEARHERVDRWINQPRLKAQKKFSFVFTLSFDQTCTWQKTEFLTNSWALSPNNLSNSVSPNLFKPLLVTVNTMLDYAESSYLCRTKAHSSTKAVKSRKGFKVFTLTSCVTDKKACAALTLFSLIISPRVSFTIEKQTLSWFTQHNLVKNSCFAILSIYWDNYHRWINNVTYLNTVCELKVVEPHEITWIPLDPLRWQCCCFAKLVTVSKGLATASFSYRDYKLNHQGVCLKSLSFNYRWKLGKNERQRCFISS